jgi:hypothetical protein
MRWSLFKSCQQSHALIYASEDRKLSLLECGALRSHVRVCRKCSTAQNNVTVLREQLKSWRQSNE